MKRLAIIILSAVAAFSGISPAQAFPVVNVPKVEAPQSQVENVQWRHHRGGWHNRRYDRGRHWRHRHYDRRRSNAGAIIGGLAAGAIIGGALAQPRYAPAPRYYDAPPRRYVGSNSHVDWCYSRYRSYRAFDNTFQPYNGPRRQCYSPFR